jgi:NAD(P)-dependent dehydrogenase (short-subunit alcohol dehydrogenase family)
LSEYFRQSVEDQRLSGSATTRYIDFMTNLALLTGGNRGLGKAMALHLAARGVDILFTYKGGAEPAKATVAELQAKGVKAAALQLDVGDTTQYPAFVEAVKKQLAAWGRDRFDYLINNAGIGLHVPVTETTEAQMDELYRVHLKATMFLTQKLLGLIADGGRILNVSTGLARFTLPGYAAYAAMKGGIEVLTRYMAKELGPRRITVNTIAPGAIETDFSGGAVRDNKDLNKMIAGMIALGRVGLPDDIGAAVSMLLSPDGAWITGQRIEVSGGQML